jgi:polysaccharide export outer membrane protein
MFLKNRSYYKFIAFFVMFLCLFSCASKKSVLYFQDSNDVNLRRLKFTSSKIQANDIININVTALNPESVVPYNLKNNVTANSSLLDILRLQGYLVSQEGNIIFPVIGSLKVTGKTTSELEVYIKKLLIDGEHVVDPAVSVKILNFKFTVLGDVQKAGTFSVTENKVTVLQALGYAGDLTINGSRKDILILREIDGVQITKRIDLTSTDWFSSDFYYIKQNDVIVVNPNLNKIKSSGIMGSAGSVMSAISLLLTTILIVIR